KIPEEPKKKFDDAESPDPPCEKCIEELHISGHGAVGGVNWVNSSTDYSNFDSGSLDQSQVDALKGMLCEDGVVRLWSCSSAMNPDMPGGIGDLAELLGVKVSGILGGCINGPNGGDHSGPDIIWRG